MILSAPARPDAHGQRAGKGSEEVASQSKSARQFPASLVNRDFGLLWYVGE